MQAQARVCEENKLELEEKNATKGIQSVDTYMHR